MIRCRARTITGLPVTFEWHDLGQDGRFAYTEMVGEGFYVRSLTPNAYPTQVRARWDKEALYAAGVDLETMEKWESGAERLSAIEHRVWWRWVPFWETKPIPVNRYDEVAELPEALAPPPTGWRRMISPSSDMVLAGCRAMDAHCTKPMWERVEAAYRAMEKARVAG